MVFLPVALETPQWIRNIGINLHPKEKPKVERTGSPNVRMIVPVFTLDSYLPHPSNALC